MTSEVLEERVVNSHFYVNNRNPKNFIAKNHYTDQSEDLRYLNTFTKNSDTTDRLVKLCEYNENRNTDFFQGGSNPANYSISVQRATIPCQSIPLFVWSTTDSLMTVTYTSALAPGYTSSVALQFVSSLTTPVATDLNVWTVGQWLRSVHNAMETAYNNVVAAYEAVNGVGSWVVNGGPDAHPILVYDNDNNFFWQCGPNYGPTTASVNLLQVSFGWNQYLNDKFSDGFYTTYNSAAASTGQKYTLVVRADGFNYSTTTSLFSIYNQFYIYDGLIQCKKLLIFTNMGIDTEQSNTFYQFNIDGSVVGIPNLTNNSNTPLRLLLDMSANFDLKTMRNIVNYLPTNIRYYNINTTEFNIINWSMKWSGQDGILRDLYLDYGQACSIKFLFTLR